jgi:hypothetical protein
VRVAITTIVRSAPLDTPSGWLRVLDLETRTQQAIAPLPDALHRRADPNPRGGLRGGRGLAATADRLAVAINDRILVLDRHWQLRDVLSHPWMGGPHDVAADDAGLWVACADNDAVLRLGWDGELAGVWHWRTDRGVRRALGHGWLPHFDRRLDHRSPAPHGLRIDIGHVNAVAEDDGALLVGLGFVRPPTPLRWPAAREAGLHVARRVGLGGVAGELMGRWRALPRNAPSAALRAVTPGQIRIEDAPQERPGWSWALVEVRSPLDRPRARVVARHPVAGAPTHNALPYDGLVAVADSARGRVLAVDRRSGAIVRSVQLPGALPFPRGMCRLDDGRLAVGTRDPASLTIVDLEGGCVDDRVPLPGDRGESPYAVAPVPPRFGDPAGRLPATRAAWGIVGADASASCM